MSLWKRKEIQKMPRRSRLIFSLSLLIALTASAADESIWREFGLTEQSTAKIGAANAAVYRMNDATGAIAAWEWQRLPDAHPCAVEAFCSTDGERTILASANYFIQLTGPVPPAKLTAFLQALPKRHDSSLPAILTFVPRRNLVPGSARYVLGPESLRNFAAPLAGVQPGFSDGVEAQVADYKIGSAEALHLVHLAIFYYPTPEMARLHIARFKQVPGVHAKRSGVLVALVFGASSDQQANSLLSQIEYEAKVTWNDLPPPNPIKPLYQLLLNIIYLSIVLVALCLMSGLIYAGIRLYRRRFGTLEEDEAMTTLHLTGD
jgi:hypothetical protein